MLLVCSTKESAMARLSDTRTRTFTELRAWALKRLGLRTHLDHHELGDLETTMKFMNFWDEINHGESERGYIHKEYIKRDSPALWQMKLLTTKELNEWKDKFVSLFPDEHPDPPWNEFEENDRDVRKDASFKSAIDLLFA